MEKINDTADFLKEEARMKSGKIFDERRKKQGIAQLMMMAAAFSAFSAKAGDKPVF